MPYLTLLTFSLHLQPVHHSHTVGERGAQNAAVLDSVQIRQLRPPLFGGLLRLECYPSSIGEFRGRNGKSAAISLPSLPFYCLPASVISLCICFPGIATELAWQRRVFILFWPQHFGIAHVCKAQALKCRSLETMFTVALAATLPQVHFQSLHTVPKSLSHVSQLQCAEKARARTCAKNKGEKKNQLWKKALAQAFSQEKRQRVGELLQQALPVTLAIKPQT